MAVYWLQVQKNTICKIVSHLGNTRREWNRCVNFPRTPTTISKQTSNNNSKQTATTTKNKNQCRGGASTEQLYSGVESGINTKEQNKQRTKTNARADFCNLSSIQNKKDDVDDHHDD